MLNAKSMKRERIQSFLVYLFFFHGALLFLYPDQYHNREGWLVLVKYILFALILVYAFSELFKNISLVTFFTTNMLFFSIGAILSSRAELQLNDVLYLVPIFTILLIPMVIRLYSDGNFVYVILLLASTFALVEYLFFSTIFNTYNRHVFRASSLFSNPNNLAIITGLAANYIVCTRRKEVVGPGIWMGLSVITVGLSGSKTGIGLLLVAALLFFFNRQRSAAKSVLLLSTSAFFLYILLTLFGDVVDLGQDGLNIRSFELKSGANRLGSYANFWDELRAGGVFPRWNFETHLDNTFIHIWGNLGLITVIYFTLQHLFLFYYAFKRGLPASVLYLCFSFCMLTTNIMYIWPTSYLYWCFCGFLVLGKPTIKANTQVQNARPQDRKANLGQPVG